MPRPLFRILPSTLLLVACAAPPQPAAPVRGLDPPVPSPPAELDAAGRLARRGERRSAPFAYAGVQVLHPRVLRGVAAEPFSTNRLWDKALASGRLFGAPMD
ncbi:MAG: hypothetical protein ACPGQD_06410, partial [Planctomycetota bacterium]